MSTIYVIVGEASGDLHASNLIRKLKAENNQLKFVGMGGANMADSGVELHFDYKAIAIMGFWEVLKQFRKLRGIINTVANDIITVAPDKLLLVDSSGFNLRIAKIIKEKTNIPVHYYIAPKIWAWAEWRIKKIKKRVDYLYCILPFEEAYFRSKGFSNAFYVGNPTVGEIEEYSFSNITLPNHTQHKQVLALLPGSRKQEISRILPTMLKAANQIKDHDYYIAQAPGIATSWYKNLDENIDENQLIKDNTWNLLNQSDRAIVTSGTATLETALIGCPQVVVYKTSPISYFLGKRLVKVKFISLVNLILNRKGVIELIQNEANADIIIKSLNSLSKDASLEIKEKLQTVLSKAHLSEGKFDSLL